MSDSSTAISLQDLNRKIRNQLRSGFSDPIWVIAEINQLNQHSSGHCYLELIEKDANFDSIKASIRGTIWSSVFNRLSAYFFTSTGSHLSIGMKVLIRVQVDFHEVYGISLNIRDIDPAFTLGDLARQRAEVIKKLEKAGVIEMNQELELPRVPQRIAIISSPSAAGYQDFCMQLDQNPGSFHFYYKLFPASMQGDQTTSSIIRALDQIANYSHFFEVVVLIRGGGSKTDLSYFDSFDLSYYLTQFPIPIITGIGHERDESVCDLVAHTSCKTPTAVAEFLIDLAEEFESEVNWMKDRISQQARKRIQDHQLHLVNVTQSIKLNSKQFHQQEKYRLHQIIQTTERSGKRFLQEIQQPLQKISNSLSPSARTFIQNRKLVQKHLFANGERRTRSVIATRKHQLELIARNCELLDPTNILRRGYSITQVDGRIIKDSKCLKPGDTITTQLHKGKIDSHIKKIQHDSEKPRNH